MVNKGIMVNGWTQKGKWVKRVGLTLMVTYIVKATVGKGITVNRWAHKGKWVKHVGLTLAAGQTHIYAFAPHGTRLG
jgi:hypothetical protein